MHELHIVQLRTIYAESEKRRGSESDADEAAYVVRDDTVENVVLGLRIEQQQHGSAAKEPIILHAAAEVMISRRDEQARARIEAQGAEFGADYFSCRRGRCTRNGSTYVQLRPFRRVVQVTSRAYR